MATILVVDDRLTNRQYLTALLGACGHETHEATNGAEALAFVRERRPDLVITDILMPTMDGYQFALALCKDTDRPRIIFHTATYSGPTAQQMAQSCGVDAVVMKPCEPAEMLATVNRVLGLTPVPAAAAAPVRERYGGAGLPADYNLAKYISKLEATKRGFDEIVLGLAGPAAARDSAQAQSKEFGANIADLRRLLFRLTVLIEVSTETAAERDPARLIEIFFGAACEIVSAERAAIAIFDEREGKLKHFYCKGIDAAVLRPVVRVGVFGTLAAEQRTVRWSRTEGPAHGQDLPPGHPPVESLLGVAVAAGDQRHGWLYFADRHGAAAFSDEDERFAAILVEKLALLYENVTFYDLVQSHAAELQMEFARRSLAESTLRESEQRFRQLADNVHEAFFLDSVAGDTLYVSPAYEEIWGRRRESVYGVPRAWAEAIHPDDRAGVMQRYEEALRTTGQFQDEFRILRPDGAMRWIRARGFPARNAAGEIYRIAGIYEDVTERKEHEERIARLSRIRQVLGGINATIVRVHERGALFGEVCRIAVENGGFALAAIVAADATASAIEILAAHGDGHLLAGRDPYLGALGQTLAAGRTTFSNDLAGLSAPGDMDTALIGRGYRSATALPLRAGGQVVAALVLAAREAEFFDADELLLLEELAGDVSFALDHIARAEQLDYLACYDVLTGLPNGTLFQDRLGQFVHGGKATTEKLAVIMVDLDRFTHVNDTLGRHVGDMLLKLVAQRLGESLGETCSLARVGANTFAVAAPALRHGTDAASLLEERILHPLAQPFRIDGGEVRLAAHAGIAVFPDDGGDAHALTKRAELALKQAKASTERFLYYSAQANARAARKIALEHQLREAIRLEQFVLHFQPKVDLASGCIVGAEALIRWQHPERGLVAPEEFIPVAEESGLIEPIGAWVIQSVCAHQAKWIANGGATVPVAFNLSALQLRGAGMLDHLRRELARHALDMGCVAVELTESAVMVNVDEAMRTLSKLQQMGMALSLDDFGTGYSSLAYLKRLPFNFVKIDKSFIADIVHNPEDAAIAKAIIAMAHLLKLHVVAEGVETQAQADYLRENGCDEMQGYFFSRPVPGEAFEAMLRARTDVAPLLRLVRPEPPAAGDVA